MGTIEDFFYQKNRQGGYAFDPPSWSQKQPEPPVTKQPTSPYTAFTQRPVATQTPQAYGTPGDFSAYKVPANTSFTQQWGAPDGSFSSTPQFGVRDAFIQNINGAISPFAANPSLAPPQLDLQALYGNAQDMVANGWQNPFTQAFQPSTPQYSGLPTAPSPQSQGIQDLFKQNNIQAPPGFIDQLITLLGGSAPRPALPSPATKYPILLGPNDNPYTPRNTNPVQPAPRQPYETWQHPYTLGNANLIQPPPQGTPLAPVRPGPSLGARATGRVSDTPINGGTWERRPDGKWEEIEQIPNPAYRPGNASPSQPPSQGTPYAAPASAPRSIYEAAARLTGRMSMDDALAAVQGDPRIMGEIARSNSTAPTPRRPLPPEEQRKLDSEAAAAFVHAQAEALKQKRNTPTTWHKETARKAQIRDAVAAYKQSVGQDAGSLGGARPEQYEPFMRPLQEYLTSAMRSPHQYL